MMIHYIYYILYYNDLLGNILEVIGILRRTKFIIILRNCFNAHGVADAIVLLQLFDLVSVYLSDLFTWSLCGNVCLFCLVS